MIEATFQQIAQTLGSLAPFLALLVIPGGWLFHRKIIKPLSFVLGFKQEDSPTGEPIPSIPVQLAEMRKNQTEMRDNQELFKEQVRVITAEVHPNGGNSLRDVVDRNDRNTRDLSMKVVDLQGTLDAHLIEERKEQAITAALAAETAKKLAGLIEGSHHAQG